MNFYEFTKNYLERLWTRTGRNVKELEIYYLPDLYAWPPFFTVKPGGETKNDMMKMFAFILQNRQSLPNIINIQKNYEVIYTITSGFDTGTIIAKGSSGLYSEFEKAGIVSKKAKKTWTSYCDGLVDAANYLDGNFINFVNYKAKFNSKVTFESERSKIMKIKGIGPALSLNYLKETVMDNAKPDTHTKAVFSSFDSTVHDDESCVESIKRYAKEGGVPYYKLDRMVWLICSGKFFKHGISIGNGKQKFIDSIKDAINKGKLKI